MAQQLAFNGDGADRQIVVDKSRSAPAVWVAELLVLRELSADESKVVRRILLRRGMNILWAREPAGQRQRQLFEDSISGHSAGKTTFCRFLRHVLGEPHFGDEQLRAEIRRDFPNGWIAGLVNVNGVPWAVYRPIGIGAHPFAVRHTTLQNALADEATREPLDSYRCALESAIAVSAGSDWMNARADLVRWDHILPWLSRDQDCHFSDLTTWRDPTSDSDSPQLDTSDRQLLLRAMLGLISDAEDSERRANDERNARRRSIGGRRPALLHQAGIDRRRLEQAFGKELPPFDDGLFGEAVNAEIREYEKRELQRNQGDIESYSAERLAQLEEDLEAAVQREVEATTALNDLRRALSSRTDALDALQGKVAEEKRQELLDDLGPSGSFCNVPIEMAQESGCPLAASRPIQFGSQAASVGLDEQVSQLRRFIANLEARVSAAQSTVAPLHASTQQIRRDLFEARRSFTAEANRLADIRSQVSHLRRLAKDAHQAWRQATDIDREDSDLKEAIDKSYKLQDTLREQLARDLASFSSRFDHFISALMGESVQGRVVFAGRDIDLKVFHRGERRSAAIKILRNIAFDLTALTFSMEGRGFHPRFLVHDGPREADMSPGLYRKVFLLVRMLEQCHTPDDQPAFQYVITTTEAPPDDMQCEPWIIEPILDAADPGKRFLGVDL